jgi:hypothetical protein
MALGLILFTVILDLTVVVPRCSDPTSEIFSPLLCAPLLNSDLTVIGNLGWVIQLSLLLLLLSLHFCSFHTIIVALLILLSLENKYTLVVLILPSMTNKHTLPSIYKYANNLLVNMPTQYSYYLGVSKSDGSEEFLL